MGWKTVRRKLQKKAKHRPYGRCPACGGRWKAWVRLVPSPPTPGEFRHVLFRQCQNQKCRAYHWTPLGTV